MGPSRTHPDSPAPSPSSRHTVVAPPNPLRSLAADAAAIHAVVASIAGPVVLVGHSYGGAVITQASATLSNVSALVYLAGFGTRVRAVRACKDRSRRRCSRRTAWRRRTTRPERPAAQICTSLTTPSASVMRATQRPLSLAALTENATAGRMEDHPIVVSRLEPRQRDLARSRGVHGRADGRNDGSHTAFIAQPSVAAALIAKAAPVDDSQ